MVVTNISSRAIPLSRNPWPTLSSLPYAWAVWMAIAELERAADRVYTPPPIRHLPHAETEERDRVAIGE